MVHTEAGLINVEHYSRLTCDDGGGDDGDDATSRNADELTAQGTTPVSILLVEDEGIVAHDLQETLTRLGYSICGIASEGAQAVTMTEALQPDMIVMDVSLRGDVDGIQAARLIQERSQRPIIFLTGHSDAETLRRAVLTEPLGYLIKPFQEAELYGAIEIAIRKHRADRKIRQREEALRRSAEHHMSMSLADELTKLSNRRGFFELAQQAIKVARREQYSMALFFMDVNGLKQINDSLGHPAGDQALRDTAEVLRHTFRDSDILARFGGDEFIVLARIHEAQDTGALCQRLRQQLAGFNASHDRSYLLDVSIGLSVIEDSAQEDLEHLIARADAAMYLEKRAMARNS